MLCENLTQPLSLKYYPDPILNYVSERIEYFDRTLVEFTDNMVSCMVQHHAYGLAAPQVGHLSRIITVQIGENSITLVNPEIINEFGSDLMEEGCLSIPEKYYAVIRSTTIEVRARTPLGKSLRFKVKGLPARIIQHEIDHLEGKLICQCGVQSSILRDSETKSPS